MTIRVRSCALRTGDLSAALPTSSVSWSVGLGDDGDLACTVLMDSEAAARPGLLAAVEPARSCLVVTDGTEVVEAGPVWSHDYDAASGVLTVRAAGLRSLWDHRRVMQVLAVGDDPAESFTTLAGSLADIAVDLVALALAHAGGSLPVVLPDRVGGQNVRTYAGHELSVLGDMLDNLSGVIGGPEIAFQPRLSADGSHLEWVMRTGTADDPLLHQPGSSAWDGTADWVWDARTPRSGVSGLSVKRDASKMAYRSWASGEGTGEALLVAWATDTEPLAHGWPLLESVTAHGSVLDPGTLQLHATADLLAGARPWTTWTMTLAGGIPRHDGRLLRPGDWAKVWIPTDHPYLAQYLPAGYYRTRVVKISGTHTQAVTVDLAPTMDLR